MKRRRRIRRRAGGGWGQAVQPVTGAEAPRPVAGRRGQPELELANNRLDDDGAPVRAAA